MTSPQLLRSSWLALVLLSAACAGKTTTSSPDGGGGKSSGGATTGGTSSGGTGGAPTEATLVLTNGSDEKVWVQTASRCAQIPAWFTVSQGGSELTVVGNCVTDCATYDPEEGPRGCPAICLVDEYEELAPGASIEFEWDGASWVADPSGCSARTPVATGTDVDVEFCVVDGAFEPDEFSAGEGPDPTFVHCDTVTVTHGASATIEHLFEGH